MQLLTYTATVPQIKSWLTGATVAANGVEAVLMAGVGLLALIYICVTTRVPIKCSSPHERSERPPKHLCS